MTGPETRLRRKIVLRLKAVWPLGYFRKVHGNQYQNVGMPDLTCCVNGIFFGLEIKCPGKKATPAQLLEGELIEKAGGFFAVVTSPDEAVVAVKRGLKCR